MIFAFDFVCRKDDILWSVCSIVLSRLVHKLII